MQIETNTIKIILKKSIVLFNESSSFIANNVVNEDHANSIIMSIVIEFIGSVLIFSLDNNHAISVVTPIIMATGK